MARVKVCLSCQYQNPAGQPFCVGCGFSLADVVISDAPTISEPTDQSLRAGTWREAPLVVQAGPCPVLKFPWGDVEVAETLFIGRDPSISPLAERINQDGFGWVSRKHAEIYVDEGKLYIRDVGSKNGTYVNGERLATQPVVLADGDQIAFSKRLVAHVRLS
jgi:pSer/pThr/pTyr-binding forkhead associated (FHA) protein